MTEDQLHPAPLAGEPEAAPPPPVFKFDKGVDAAQVWISAFLIVVAGIIAYSNALRIPFHVADQRLIRDNAPLHSLTTFPDALDARTPQPLTMLSFALNWRVTPDNAVAFHLVNMLLHLANGLLVFMLARALFGTRINSVIAMLAGMLFLVLPFNAECVEYIVGRSTLLATFFALCSILLWLRAIRGQQDGTATVSVPRLALSLLCFVCAWASDETALLLPVFILAADWTLHGKQGVLARLGIHGYYWGLGVILLLVRWGASGMWPFPVGLPALGIFVGIVALFAIRVFPAFAAAWYAGAYLLASALVPDSGDRAHYLASVGLALVVPWVFTVLRLPPLRVAAGIAAAALILSCGYVTYMRNILWQDEVMLWTHFAEKAPDSATVERNLGNAYLTRAGDSSDAAAAEALEDAEQHLRRALELDPHNVEALQNLGLALKAQDKSDDALATFLDVLRRHCDNRQATLQIASMLLDKAGGSGDLEEASRAVEYCRRADTLEPLPDEVLARYATTLLAIGNLDGAAPLLQRVVRDQKDSPLQGTLRNVQESLRRVRGMEQAAAAALAKNAADPAALKMRAQSFALRGQSLQAASVLDRLMRATPQDFSLWVLMGFVRARMKETDLFLKEWAAPPPKPEDAKSAWIELGRTCAATGLWDAAAAYLESETAVAETGKPALLALAEIALEVRQPRRAYDYLKRATEAYPDNPAPWLRLCDLASGGKDASVAAEYLAEAEKRGAAPDELAKRKARLGISAEPKEDTTTTIIR